MDDAAAATSRAPARHAPDERLASLYRSLLPAVFGYCRTRLPLHDAEDLTAEVFRAAAEALRADPDAELSRSWFFTVAQNRIIDKWRRDARWRTRLQVLAADDRGVVEGPGAVSDVVEALDRLSTVHRSVLVLHHVEGRPIAEVAKIVGRSPRAVESLLVRARRSLLELVPADDIAEAEPSRSTGAEVTP